MVRRVGLRSFPRRGKGRRDEHDGEKTLTGATRRVSATPPENLIFRSEVIGRDGRGQDALNEYFKAIAWSHPKMYMRIWLMFLNEELREDCRKSGRPIPPALRRR
jgi:hypothetical protein